MSKIIKIQSLKNSSSVLKVKTVANEKYIIVDETGKPLNKLKFVQKDKNLEIYTDVDGKEQQIVTLEDYYAPDMNASVVGLDETSEELAYIYNANDGWSYLELEDTAFGFATPLLGIGAAGAAGAGIAAAGGGGGNGGNDDNNTNTAQANILAQIGNEGDNPDTVNSVVTAAQLASLSGITGVINANEDAYQDYIDANPDSFASPATLAEVQAMITAVNALEKIANYADSNANPAPTVQDYIDAGITGVDAANLAAVNAKVDAVAKTDADTVPEVQAMITAVNALEKIANYADSNANPAPTVQDYIDAGITGVDAANLAAVNAKVDAVAKTDADTVPEVQAMITAVNALEKIANYADSNANPAPTVQDYIDAGITGVDAANLAAVNAKVDAVAKTDADTVPEVQAMITAVNALEKIANYADSNANPAPTVQDYIDAGITGVDAANLAAVNAKVDAVAKTDADTVPEVQAMITAVNALEKIANYADSNANPAPTVQDYIDAGITGVDAANLAAVNAKVDAVAKTDADTVPEVQAMITAVNALEKIANYADSNANPAPTVQDYIDAGITGVDAANLAAVNAKVDAVAKTDADTVPEVQAMITAVNALEKIANYADSNANPAPTVQDYIDAGITGVDAANLAAVNAKVDAVAKTDADTVPEVQAMITAVNALEKIANYADSNANPAPTVQDYIDAGITGVDAANLAAVNAKVDAVAKTDADTVPEVQAMITAVNALEKIANYADSNANPAPTVQDYIDAGITGVDAANLAAVNAKVDAVAKTDADTVPEVQAMITAVNALEKIANYADSNANPAPTVQDYIDAGITGVDAANLAAVNAKVDAVAKTDADTVPEVQAMITAVNALEKIANYADSNANPAPTVQDYIDAGITGVDAANLAAVNAKVDAVAKTDADTVPEVQAMITAVNALEKIANYADSNANPAPTVQDYIDAGITGVDAANLAAVNAKVDAVAKTDADTVPEVQAMITAVNALEKIANYADSNANPAPTVQDYIDAGITGVDAANLAAVNAKVDAVAKTDADTVPEVQAMITAVNALEKIANYADSNANPAPTVQDYIDAGITGVDAANLAAVNAKVDAVAKTDADTVPEVQAMITAVNALEKIANYADSNANPAPTVQDYIDAGITGVDAANLAAVNAKVDAVAKTDADTVPEVQAMITAVNALEKIANYADSNANPAPTVQDYIDAGITGVDAANLAAVNAKVDAVAKTDADTVPEVQAMITAVNALEKIANYADSNANPAPTVQDYIDAGITGVDAANLAAVNAKVDAVAKTDADTVPEVQAMITAVNALEKIANYADSNANPAPTVQDYIDAGITGVDAANLAAVNAKVDAVAKTDADTVPEVQAMITAVNALEKIANYADSNANPAPTVQDYIDAGITGVDAANLAAVNAKVDAVAKTDADTVPEVQAMITAVNALEKIANYADSNANPAPTVQDYIDAGITGVDAANLAAVNAKVDAVAKTDADTVPEVQAMITAVNALEKIANYADSNANPAPTVQDYIDAGITGVDAANLAAVNAKVDAVAKTDADTVPEVQAMITAVNALEKIANYADSNANPAPTVQDYIDAGITGVDAANLAAVNAKVDAVAKTDADTVPEVQAMITAVNALEKIANYADSNANPAPTVQDYIDAGITGVDAANLAAVNAKVDAVAKTDADTVPEVQAMITAVNALEKIANYADSNANPAPTVQDYIDAGITGVTDVSTVNSYLATSEIAGTNVDTVSEVQTLIDTVAKITTLADGVTATGTALIDTDITNLGLSATIDDVEELKLFNEILDKANATSVDTASEVKNLASIVDRIATVAAGGTASQSLSAADFTAIGITDMTTARATDLVTKIAATADDGTGVDTLAEIQALVDIVAPVFSSSTSATTAENVSTSTTVYDANATDNGGVVDAGITYTISGTDASLFNINSAGEVKFNASPNFEAPDDSGADNIYDFTVRATDTAGNYADKDVAVTVTDVVEAGQSVIDLGAGNGQLINGVQVEGKWYYYWDKNGDGTSSGADITTHDFLDGIFKYDINGNLDTDSNTDNTYRYATLNGVKVALPTYGGANETATDTGHKAGTAVSNNTTTDNPTYNDLLAIWDSFNGTGTGSDISGTPSGWAESRYWSASPTSSGHASVFLDDGYVSNSSDNFGRYVALQVLFDTKSPLFSSTTTATIAENAAISTVVYDANATYNGGAVDAGITYTISGTDASLFNINSAGQVKFNTSPDFEAPADSGADNTYDITIKATDVTGNYTTQNVAIGVTDVALGPVVIDLDGDGTISYTQKIMDVNSDGILDKTAWVDSNDGVLIWDKYQDGKVHDSSQYELSQYGGNTDLEGLAAGFDSNYDGVFDQKDEKFAQFAIWQDLNNDGMSQDGEVKTLADWGINSINLTSDGITRTDDAGVIEAGRTIATKTDGSEVVIGDAGFEYTTAQDDSIFASLQIWVDANVDGKTNSEELYKLEDLNSQNTSSVDNGNIQGLVSNWTDTDDNSHEMVDVWFKTQEVSQNTISDTSAWTTSTVSEVNNQSYVVYANTQIVIEEESKSQNII